MCFSMVEIKEIKNEERLIPLIRARLAERLAGQGLQIKEIAEVLNVTRPAVTQYLRGKRGSESHSLNHVDEIVNPLAEKLVKRMRSTIPGGLETMELLETARQLMIMNKGGKVALVSSATAEDQDYTESMKLLKERLQLELTAAEKYLELANRTSDEHAKLLFRLIASDSIKHGDIVSQIVSWLEIRGTSGQRFQAPDRSVLEQMISLEDSAKEVNLRRSVKASHRVARLLLEWIDMDEEKHDKIISKILRLSSK